MKLKENNNPQNTKENEAKFFQSIFCLSKSENSAIAVEILRLCDLLLPQYKIFFSEMDSLIEEANKHLNEDSKQLSTVYDELQDDHLLTANYIAAFISAEIRHTHYNHKQFDQYKALTLLVIMHLSSRGSHDHKSLCNELRQCALGARKELTHYLPNILISDFSELIDNLDKLQHIDLSYPSLSNQIGNIKVPFQYIYNNKKKIKRNVKSREFKKEGRLQSSKKQYLDDDKDTHIVEIKELTFGESHKVNNQWIEEEELSTTSRTLTIISSAANVKKDYSVQAIRARAINEHIRKKSMMLTCDISRFTPYELHTLVLKCITSLRYEDLHQEVARALLLMLVTGNSFDEVVNWQALRTNTRSIIGIKRKFKLPSQEIKEKLKPILKVVNEDYPLFLPLNLVSHLKNFDFLSIKEKDLKTFLSELNKAHDTRLTLSKVSSYLTQILKAQGIDCTVIDLITGYSTKNQPARFYTHIPYQRLHSIYDRYLNHIGHAGGTNYLEDREKIDENLSKKNLGSPLFIDDHILQSLLSHMRIEVIEESQKHSIYFSEKSHNRRLLFLQVILSIASGYRPVEGWFGSIHDIHFSSGEYRIAEKERLVGYSGRVILLPEIVLTHIQEYIDYCKRAIIYFIQSNSTLAKRYKESIQGNMPFCFYRHQQAMQETTPSTYMQHIKLIFPLPENWARHYLRSFLFSHNIPDELIGAWMGHRHSNQLPFAQFSQLSRKELNIIRDLLEDHITKLLLGELL